ncbi:MAG: Hint domain-containing protein [Planktotalea sp.]|uniref:Hint domain-containing protein n=1 Tax=Planktotalea sp. TaxID=2029877 RepID=UPI003C793E64
MARRENEVQASEDHVVLAETRQSGLCADTIILTMDGELRACDVAPGDRIITRDAGMAVLRGVRRKRVMCEGVQIKAGSLGHTRPPADMLLPCGTQILIRDWRAKALYASAQKLVPAVDLLDGEFVTLVPEQELEIVEFIFDTPHVIYAGGLEIGCQTLS